MDLTYGSINFSPSPFATKLCLVLDESELQTADSRQIERFWRVWYKDRAEYAPNLKDFTLLLQPKFIDENTVETVGIDRFLQYFRDKVIPYSPSHQIKIMMDQFSEEFHGIRYQIAHSYEPLFEVQATYA